MRGRYIVFGTLAVLLVLLIAVAWCQRESKSPPQGEVTLVRIVAQLSSSDRAERQAAQSALLALGPDSVEGLRQMSELLPEILAMHDKLIASPDQTKNWSTIKKEATEAIEYFASRGAVRYLVLGLRSGNLDVQVRTALALAELDAKVKEEHRYFLVSTLAAFLEAWPLPRGSETATIGRRIQQILAELLADLIGVDAEQVSSDELLDRANEWLKAHAVEQDAPAGQDVPSDEEPPKKE